MNRRACAALRHSYDRLYLVGWLIFWAILLTGFITSAFADEPTPPKLPIKDDTTIVSAIALTDCNMVVAIYVTTNEGVVIRFTSLNTVITIPGNPQIKGPPTPVDRAKEIASRGRFVERAEVNETCKDKEA